MPASLDYNTHPHIIDTIVRCAPVGALIPLRATCKAIQRLVDSILFAHVQLQTFLEDESATTSYKIVGLTLPADTRLDVASALPRLPWVPSAVRVIDDPGDGPRRGWSLQYGEGAQFSALDTMRCFQTSDRMPTYHDYSDFTLVYFATVSTCTLTVSTKISSSSRLVLHVRMESEDPRNTVWVFSTYDIKDTVLVFWPPFFPDETWYFNAIWRSTHYKGRKADDINSVTVVGLETLCDLATASDSTADRARAADAFRARMKRYIQSDAFRNQSITDRWHSRDDADDDRFLDILFAVMELRTMDEWRDELGDRRDIDGKWMDLRPVSLPAGGDTDFQDPMPQPPPISRSPPRPIDPIDMERYMREVEAALLLPLPDEDDEGEAG